MADDGLRYDWSKAQSLLGRAYRCGHCGNQVGPNTGYSGSPRTSDKVLFIYICSYCTKPTFFDRQGEQVPGVPYGRAVEHLPADIGAVYEEARRCMSVNAYTSAVLGCRKLLLHLAVDRGAKEGQSFKAYVDHLVDNHYVPPGADAWLTKVRDAGNEATHELVMHGQEDALALLKFIELLLRFMYEFPGALAAVEAEGTEAAEGAAAQS
jgi:hypothetical protein